MLHRLVTFVGNNALRQHCAIRFKIVPIALIIAITQILLQQRPDMHKRLVARYGDPSFYLHGNSFSELQQQRGLQAST
jgi:hypothetical protein